jgi:hypothetical protein
MSGLRKRCRLFFGFRVHPKPEDFTKNTELNPTTPNTTPNNSSATVLALSPHLFY